RRGVPPVREPSAVTVQGGTLAARRPVGLSPRQPCRDARLDADPRLQLSRGAGGGVARRIPEADRRPRHATGDNSAYPEGSLALGPLRPAYRPRRSHDGSGQDDGRAGGFGDGDDVEEPRRAVGEGRLKRQADAVVVVSI